MKNENKKEKSDLIKIEQKEKDEILQSLIKENEILTKLTKQKITPKGKRWNITKFNQRKWNINKINKTKNNTKRSINIIITNINKSKK